MAKRTYEAPEAEFVQLAGDVVTASSTSGETPGGGSTDVPGFGGEGDGEDYG